VDRPKNLPDLKARFKSLFERAKGDMASNPDSVFVAAAKKAIQLVEQQKDLTVLHGDLHYGNIVYGQEENWLAIDPKGLIGEVTYDLANLICNPDDMPEISQNRVRVLMLAKHVASEYGGLDYLRLLEWVYVHGALAASWELDAGNDPTHWLVMSYLASSHVLIEDMYDIYMKTGAALELPEPLDLKYERAKDGI